MIVPPLVRMISRMFARKARTHRPPVPRLRLEWLEAREAPATWNPVPVYDMMTNTTSFDTLASNPNNWTFGYGESINYFITASFDSRNTLPCDGFSGSFDAININSGYTGTITLNSHLTVVMFYQGGGTIDQPLGEDSQIFIAQWWLWEGGTLNSTETPSTVTVDGTLYPGMSSGAIVPVTTGTVITGSTIQFVNGATGAVQPGEVVFNNDADFIVDDGSEVECQTTPTGTIDFTAGTVAFLGNRTWVKAGGLLTVPGGGTWTGFGVPLLNAGGTFRVRDGSTASFTGLVGPANEAASYRQTGATSVTVIDEGSRIRVASGMYLGAGKLSTAHANRQGGAVIEGNVVNTGADIAINDVAYNPAGVTQHVFDRLYITGDSRWSGGVFRAAVDTAEASRCDWISVDKKMYVSDGAKIGPIEVGNPLGAAQVGWQWRIFIASEIIIPAGNNTPGFEVPGQEATWDLVQENAAPVTWWRIKWTG